MALIQTSLVWITYAVVIAFLICISSVFVYLYQKPRERAASITTVCIFTTSCLLATILLLPVDVALVSSTVSVKDGTRKQWATDKAVDNILLSLKVVYYSLYSLVALLCLLVIPFTYFFYEEYDEVEQQDGTQTLRSRSWTASKYTLGFLVFVILLFIVGFFLPIAGRPNEKHRDMDYFKRLLAENNGEKALTFALGLLITLGTLVYTIYTGAGLALLPITFVKSAPSISAPSLAANTASQLEQNLERQHQLEARNEGRQEGLDSRDRRELDALVNEERNLRRRERLARESAGEGQHALLKVWHKIEAIFRPVKLLCGVFFMLVSIVIWLSMLITAIDKVKNSVCGRHCGYLLGSINIFQPINFFLVKAARVFPIDYALFVLLVLFLFSASVVAIATVGIRFLWLTIFKIRKGNSSPQALLMATTLLALMVLAINYAVTNFIAPQYSIFGPQTYCDMDQGPSLTANDTRLSCSDHPDRLRPCSEAVNSKSARDVCTPSVMSTFINRINVNFPFFGLVSFWAQFAFLGVFLIVAFVSLIRTPKMDTETMDDDLEEEEEEGLLASTGRRFNATWQDITGRARRSNNASYGTTSNEGN